MHAHDTCGMILMMNLVYNNYIKDLCAYQLYWFVLQMLFDTLRTPVGQLPLSDHFGVQAKIRGRRRTRLRHVCSGSPFQGQKLPFSDRNDEEEQLSAICTGTGWQYGDLHTFQNLDLPNLIAYPMMLLGNYTCIRTVELQYIWSAYSVWKCLWMATVISIVSSLWATTQLMQKLEGAQGLASLAVLLWINSQYV